jgi:hypothetical protein
LSALSFQRRFYREQYTAWISHSHHRFDCVAGSHSLAPSAFLAPMCASASPRSGYVAFVGLVIAGAQLLYSFFTAACLVQFERSSSLFLQRAHRSGGQGANFGSLVCVLPRARASGFWISTSACFGFSCLRFLFTFSIYPLPQCFAVW